MKKLFFSLIATVMISSFAIANTNEMKENDFIKNQEIVLTNTQELNEDDFWFCYEIGRDSSTDLMTGDTIITVTYRCRWYSL
jgi:hypothetical protein